MKIEDILSEEQMDEAATGNFYETAYEIMERLKAQGKNPTLIHGRPVLQGGEFEGCQYGHAWVISREEIPGSSIPMCFSEGLEGCVPEDLFNEAGEIDTTLSKSYTYGDMVTNLDNFKHYGPWE